jgi:hypothetical protein
MNVTRRLRHAVNTTYMDVGSADIASLQGCSLVGQAGAIAEEHISVVHVRSDPAPTTMDGGSAGFAGAKNCHVAYGLRRRIPLYTSDIINSELIT